MSPRNRPRSSTTAIPLSCRSTIFHACLLLVGVRRHDRRVVVHHLRDRAGGSRRQQPLKGDEAHQLLLIEDDNVRGVLELAADQG